MKLTISVREVAKGKMLRFVQFWRFDGENFRRLVVVLAIEVQSIDPTGWRPKDPSIRALGTHRRYLRVLRLLPLL